MSSTHALYRFFDQAGELLYVGITMNPAARWKKHSKEKDWWLEVANIAVEGHADRAAVLEAERLAILTEKPRYNVVHNHQTITLAEFESKPLLLPQGFPPPCPEWMAPGVTCGQVGYRICGHGYGDWDPEEVPV